MKKESIAILTFVCLFTNAFSQVKDSIPKGVVQVTPNDIEWTDYTENVPPPGLKMFVLYGNPKEAGPFAVRFKLPAKYIMPIHWHKTDEAVTVLEGSMNVGYGSLFRISQTKSFPAGSFYLNPANGPHYVFAGQEGAVIQINGIGPWSTHYLKELKQNYTPTDTTKKKN